MPTSSGGRVRGEFTIGDLTFLAGSFLRLRSLLEGLLLGFSQIAGQALYLDDLFSFFEIRPAILSPPNPLPFPRPIREGFVFEDVGFRYPGRRALGGAPSRLRRCRPARSWRWSARTAPARPRIVKLLARLYDPDEGRILLDGHDLRDYDLDALRANIGVIFQDFVRYHFTAGENIGVGRIDARGRPRAHRGAAERSLADRSHRPAAAGYDQPLGKRFNERRRISPAASGRRSPSPAPTCATPRC